MQHSLCSFYLRCVGRITLSEAAAHRAPVLIGADNDVHHRHLRITPLLPYDPAARQFP